jgi:2-oxoglutarate ferredoxin oxidoreductase subunit beta
MAGNGYSMVEVVASCNSGWKLSPVEANRWMEENVMPNYVMGDVKCSTLPK